MPEPGILILNIAATIRIAGIELVVINMELLRTKRLGTLEFLFLKMLNWC